MKSYPLFINGEFVETKRKQKLFNPATGELIAEVSLASAKEAEEALRSAKATFDSGAWPGLALDERKKFLLKIAQGILDKAGELAELETLNNGKPLKESTFMDIPSSAKSFEHVAENFQGYLREESPKLPEEAECGLLREPLGVVVLIVPWNYPLLIACWKLSSALAAGNTVILKPSSLTPLTALELGGIIKDAGLPAGAVNIINGSGQELGELLCSDPRVDMVSFTGSNEVGRQITAYTAKSAKKAIMELGGKSASIIFKDADMEAAVNSSLASIFLNQGQMCTAMSRILVEGDVYDAFIESLVSKAKRIKLGNGLDAETQMGPLISESQRKRVADYVERAKKAGAKVLCGGSAPQDPDLRKGSFFEPTVLADVSPSMEIFRDEVFGPVVCVSRFSSFAEALSLANASEYGLAACIWTKDKKKTDEASAKLNAGIIWVNTYGMFYNAAPYGGFKRSGFGKELGREGFLEYTRLKDIIIDKSADGKPLVNYWYGL